ncbi:hypothetical protein MRY87_12115 [bacterium]|nr:hypothetical protein [bacterium]
MRAPRFLLQLVLSVILFWPFSLVRAESPAGTSAFGHDVSPVGSAELSVPLALPPGAGGLTPKIGMRYSNHSPNGALGIGWSLSGLSSISRCAASWAQERTFADGVDFDALDRLCLDGERLMLVAGEYWADGSEYRTEHETFSKIRLHRDAVGVISFTVFEQSGRIVRYGTESNQRVSVAGRGELLHWMISEIEDRFGNTIEFSFRSFPSDSTAVIEQISYGGNRAVSQGNQVHLSFSYEDRPDVIPAFIDGARVALPKRLRRIDIVEKGDLFRRYELRYEVGSGANNSHLREVQECGYDGSCLLPLTFEWYRVTSDQFHFTADGSGYWTAGDGASPPFTADFNGDGRTDFLQYEHGGDWRLWLGGDTDFIDSGLWRGHSGGPANNVVGDFNGDGRSDIAGYSSGGAWDLCLSTPQGGFNCSFWQGHSGGPANNIVADFNGDGRSDMAGYAGAGRWHLCFSEGDQFACEFHDAHDRGFDENLTGDFNGDGKADLSTHRGGSDWEVCLSDDGGFSCDVWSGPAGDLNSVQSGDFNGDGKTDLLRYDQQSDWEVCRATGAGFRCEQWQGHSDRTNNIIGDFNGDGLSDIAGYTGNNGIWHVVLSRGYDFQGTGSGYWQGHSGAFGLHRIGDFNGDGRSDLAAYTGANGRWHVALPGGTHPDLIARALDGHGKEVRFDYAPLSDATVHTPNRNLTYPAISLQGPLFVTKAFQTSNGIGGFTDTRFHYFGATLNLRGRGFRGFEKVERSDHRLWMKETTEYRTDHRYLGTPIARRERATLNGNLLSREENSATFTRSPNGVIFSSLESGTSEFFDLAGTRVKRIDETWSYDSFGNVLSHLRDFGEGFREATLAQYENDAQNWLIGRVSERSVTRSSPASTSAVSRLVRFQYASHTGALEREIIEPTLTELRLEKVLERDAYGNVSRSREYAAGFPDRISESTYEAGRRLATETNPLGHVRRMEYERGHLVREVHPNGTVTAHEYDPFGRKVLTTTPTGHQTRYAYLLCDHLCPTNGRYFVRQKPDTAGRSRVAYDELDREVRRDQKAFDGRIIFTDTEYDTALRQQRQSAPYFRGDTPQWSSWQYDALGRPTEVHPVGLGVTTYQYVGRRVREIDPDGIVLEQRQNALGEVAEVWQDGRRWVSYEYDGYWNAFRIIDADGNTTETTFDRRGFRREVDDPTTGRTTFQVNPFGDEISRTNALGERTEHEYDSLGRVLLTREEKGETTAFAYDGDAHAIGQLSAIEKSNGYSLDIAYDRFGRLLRRSTWIAGELYETAIEYDQQSRVQKRTFPTGVALLYSYNTSGYLERIREEGSGQTLWQTLGRDARGELTAGRYGNGLREDRVYTPWGSVAQISTNGVYDVDYRYNHHGLLDRRRDLLLAREETFTYDRRYRLSGTQVQGGYGVTVQYDDIGNITSRSDLGTYHYEGQSPHAVTRVSTARGDLSLEYTAVGDLAAFGGLAVKHDRNHRPRLLAEKKRSAEIFYSTGNHPFLRAEYGDDGAEQTVFLEDFEEHRSRDTVRQRHFVRVDGKAVAVIERELSQRGVRDRTLFLHRDHLDSVSVITDENAFVEERLSYDAWGRRRPSDWSAPFSGSVVSALEQGFTGHRHLDLFETEVLHMGARLYSPVLGRMLSPDTFVSAQMKGDSLNRYSYAQNQPLNLTDPSGFFLKGLVKLVKRYWRYAAIAAVGYASGYSAVQLFSLTGPTKLFVQGAASGFGGAFSGSLLHGGSFASSLRAGLVAGAVGGTGLLFSGELSTVFPAVHESPIAHTAASGAFGAVNSALQGGNAFHGLVEGVAGAIGGEHGSAGAAVSRGLAGGLVSGEVGSHLATSVSGYFGKTVIAEQTTPTSASAPSGGGMLPIEQDLEVAALQNARDAIVDSGSLLSGLAGEIQGLSTGFRGFAWRAEKLFTVASLAIEISDMAQGGISVVGLGKVSLDLSDLSLVSMAVKPLRLLSVHVTTFELARAVGGFGLQKFHDHVGPERFLEIYDSVADRL